MVPPSLASVGPSVYRCVQPFRPSFSMSTANSVFFPCCLPNPIAPTLWLLRRGVVKFFRRPPSSITAFVFVLPEQRLLFSLVSASTRPFFLGLPNPPLSDSVEPIASLLVRSV